MEDFLENIEKTRNTGKQIDYYNQLSKFTEETNFSLIRKINNFPVYTSRQIITSFIEKYEVYKLCKNVPGSIVECGVADGFGLMTFAHLCSIFEPYHYVRKVIGFDTFEGFRGVSKKDKTSSAEHMKEGGLSFSSYEVLDKAIRLYEIKLIL